MAGMLVTPTLTALAFARSGIQSPSRVVMREELGAWGQDV